MLIAKKYINKALVPWAISDFHNKVFSLQNRRYFLACCKGQARPEHKVGDTRDGRGTKINNACMPTIVHAIPPTDTPSNHQPITVFDKSGAKQPRTERPPAKMKDVGQSDENANTEINKGLLE